MTEAAVVAQGIKGGPMRAGHQGMMMANTAQMVSGRRYNQIASGRAASSGSGPPAVGAGAGGGGAALAGPVAISIPGETRSEEHTSELQSLMRSSYAVFCLKKKKTDTRKVQDTTWLVTR